MSIAAVLNGLRESQQRLFDDIKAEYDDAPAKKALAGDNGDQHQELDLRKDTLRAANDTLTKSVEAWTQARNALLDDRDERTASTLANEALGFYDQALRLFRPEAAPPVPEPAKAKDTDDEPMASVESDKDTAEDSSGPPVPPVVVLPGQRSDARDGTLLPLAPVSPDDSESDKDKEEKGATVDSPEEPAWVKSLQNSVRGALEDNAETIRQHVEACGTRLDEFETALGELKTGTVSPELARVISTYTEDGLTAALSGGANAHTLLERLDGIDLDKLAEILALFGDEDNFSAEDLRTALAGGRWVNGKRWNRGAHQ